MIIIGLYLHIIKDKEGNIPQQTKIGDVLKSIENTTNNTPILFEKCNTTDDIKNKILENIWDLWNLQSPESPEYKNKNITE